MRIKLEGYWIKIFEIFTFFPAEILNLVIVIQWWINGSYEEKIGIFSL